MNGLGLLRTRQKEREREGSPVFPFKNASAIAAGGSYRIDFTENKYRKYLPFDGYEFINESDNEVDLIISEFEPRHIPAYGIRGVLDDPVWRVKVVNQGADSIPAGELVFQFWRQREIDKPRKSWLEVMR